MILYMELWLFFDVKIQKLSLKHQTQYYALYFMFHRFLEITWRQEYDHIADENCTSYAPTQMRMNATYISIYVTWMYLVFMYIIPFTTLACFNLKTWLEMRKASGENY